VCARAAMPRAHRPFLMPKRCLAVGRWMRTLISAGRLPAAHAKGDGRKRGGDIYDATGEIDGEAIALDPTRLPQDLFNRIGQ
jgi:hypothetical protein